VLSHALSSAMHAIQTRGVLLESFEWVWLTIIIHVYKCAESHMTGICSRLVILFANAHHMSSSNHNLIVTLLPYTFLPYSTL
jgi:hypothetical protein